MNPKLSDRVNEMATSATLAMAAKARSLKEEGVSIIGLSLGEPDFTVPEFVKEAAIKAIEADYHSYSPVDGYAEFKKAIAHKFKRDNKVFSVPKQKPEISFLENKNSSSESQQWRRKRQNFFSAAVFRINKALLITDRAAAADKGWGSWRLEN